MKFTYRNFCFKWLRQFLENQDLLTKNYTLKFNEFVLQTAHDNTWYHSSKKWTTRNIPNQQSVQLLHLVGSKLFCHVQLLHTWSTCHRQQEHLGTREPYHQRRSHCDCRHWRTTTSTSIDWLVDVSVSWTWRNNSSNICWSDCSCLNLVLA